MGIITSLGQGLKDNWAALTSGVGHPRDQPFPDRRSFDAHRGTVDFIDIPVAENAVERSYAFARETTIEALARPIFPAISTVPLFLAAPPIEPEWSARFELADRSPPADHPGDAYDRFLAAMRERPIRRSTRRRCSARFPSACRPVRHARPAGDVVDGLCIGRDRDPARRRSDPPGPHDAGA
jgi:hypothetical protein